MCGIAGFYIPTINTLYHIEINTMLDTLAHRGPDNKNYIHYNGFYLGHRRLSIIDLSPQANQPMISKNQNFVIVFNGELYNFKELANKYNLNTTTHSDTEVVVESIAKYGISALCSFNGMFAFAILDKQKNKLILARDRIGIKPLFYFWDGKHFAFASEIKALLCLSFIKENLKINENALEYYFHLGFIPEPLTIYQNIYKFPAGHYATFNNNNLEFYSYWSIFDKINKPKIKDEVIAKKQLNDLLNDSIKLHLQSDVPYGIFLSGGIDSSIVTAIAKKYAGQLKTFSLGFTESSHDESEYARQIAQYLKTEHYSYTVSYNDALLLINDIIDQYDEPFADASAIPTMIVSKLARQEVTMVLSGEGGDELFWGYGSYRWAKRLHSCLSFCYKHVFKYALQLGSSRYRRIASMLNFNNDDFLPAHILSQEQYFFSKHEISSLLKNIAVHLTFKNESDLQKIVHHVERQSIFDLLYYLKDDLLVKVDRASMKYSLEVRVPLLDYRIVEFAYHLDPELKIHHNIQKYLLKQVLFDYLPASLFQRPKWGFSLPLHNWLKNELKPLVLETLNNAELKHNPFVDASYVNKLLKAFYSNKCDNYLYGRIWNLLIFQRWFNKYRKELKN